MLTEGFNLINILRIGVDIALVWYVIYKLIMIIRGTKAIQLLKGIFVVVIVWVLSIVLNLHTIQWLTNQAILWGFLVIIILFQPELRRALEQLGRGSIFTRSGRSEEEKVDKVIDSIVTSAEYMGKRRIGALITIEQETGIDDYAETGTLIGGILTSQLLTNIFTPNTPLHDGAVIIRQDKIIAAACYLPLSESAFIAKEVGTRHRAAIGVSEVKDALTIIDSEERGAVSCTKMGELLRDLDSDQLREFLVANLKDGIKQTEVKSDKEKGNENG